MARRTVTLLASVGLLVGSAALPTAAGPALAADATTATAGLPAGAGAGAGPAPAPALDDGLARTPPMGFNNWNDTACGAEFDEAYVKAMADLFVSTGLKDAGYEYINLDDCWARPQSSPEGSRDADGHLVPDPVRFPNGIGAVADYVHDRGLKFGIYHDRGTRTCNDLGFDGTLGADWTPGARTYEEIDARDFADWGVDYLKYDNCNNEGLDAVERYTAMRDALRAATAETGRPIVHSICEWGENQPWTWGADIGELWRTTGDIAPNYPSMSRIARFNLTLAEYAGPGHWNDPDMLQVGNGTWSVTEQRTHFSLWSIMAAPLLIGTDLRRATPQTMEILLNRDVIAVDQDPLGIQGKVVGSAADGHYVIAKPLANGDVAVALWNDTPTTARIGTSAAEIGLPKAPAYTLRDLWTHTSTSTAGKIAASVPAHGAVMYRVRPGTPGEAPPSTALGVRTKQRYLLPGRQSRVTATLENNARVAVEDASLSLSTPDGWTAEPVAPTDFGAIRPGGSVTARWVLTAPEGAVPGRHPVSARAAYVYGADSTPASQEASDSVVVPPPPRKLSESYDNKGISDDGNTDAADFDGNGASFSAQALAAAGAVPGAELTHGGTTFTWPDVPAGEPDNVVASGETLELSGSGRTLGLLTASAYGQTSATGAVLYDDGSAREFTVSVPDWYAAPPADGDSAIVTPYRNRPGNVQQPRASGVHVYFVGVPLDPARTVRGVVLPEVSEGVAAGQNSLHVFSVGIG
ncbi:NEW3 domain-containing protein [Streptomyces sp. WMMC500]|uniref:NEW3 domain-containing protein n=1 Tax=Streptomyces sp. WMMC500 TaxID=3015154 RepID=UPI00248BE24D|nr:NEW3 domain-containing protein [Streptomyces sp. WMMC500]WBB64128.1 NEW3 domain-containing protein [Streptomyces sp. WMMC500]